MATAQALGLSEWLYGIHDPGGEALLAGKGTIFITEEIGADPDAQRGRDYSRFAKMGLTVVVRLNYGYEPKGTIPPSALTGKFAESVALFIARSAGCHNWSVGNEPNYRVEWPQLANGERQKLTPNHYAATFNSAVQYTRRLVGEGHRFWLAAVAPWNIDGTYPGNEGGDWIKWFADTVELTRGYAGGILLHTYTHGQSPALVASSELMRDAPYQERYYHFLAFAQFMWAIPAWARGLPVGISEADQDGGWADTNSGWVQAAYTMINQWNENPANQPIQFMCLYRWEKHSGQEQYSISDRTGVQMDLIAAIARGYRAKMPTGEAGAGANGSTILLPYLDSGAATDPNPTPAPLPEYPADFDPRLIERGAHVVRAEGKPGDLVWRLTRGRWYNKAEAGGRRNTYVNVYGETGERMIGATLRAKWPSDSTTFKTENKPPGEAMGNHVLSPGERAFSYWVEEGGYPSDAVIGVGMGEATPTGFNPGEHTSNEFDWRLERIAAPVVIAPPPKPKPAPSEPVVPPQPVTGPVSPVTPGALNPYLLEAILAVESGADGFNADGSLKIRIEAHILDDYLAPAAFAAHFRYDPKNAQDAYYRPDPGAPWIAYHALGQRGEWAAFKLAGSLDRRAALLSISMGAPQIMGFHYADIGYPTPEDMFIAFTRSEAVQINAFWAFLMYKPGLWAAVRAGDLGAIARLYNGNERVYKPLLEAAYRRLTGR